MKSEKLRNAWMDEEKRPQIEAALKKDFLKALPPVNATATTDNEAIVSAVRSAQPATPPPEKTRQQYAHEVAGMSDAEFLQMKEKLDPSMRRRI